MKFVAAIMMTVVALVPHGHHRDHHVTPRQFAGYCLSKIIDSEDPSWSPRQWNIGGSGAYGLPQALPGYKMASAGSDWRTNPFTQIRWMRRYTRIRYGSECAALRHHEIYGTY